MWHSLQHLPHHSFLHRLPVESGSQPPGHHPDGQTVPLLQGWPLCRGAGPASRATLFHVLMPPGLCLLRPLACPSMLPGCGARGPGLAAKPGFYTGTLSSAQRRFRSGGSARAGDARPFPSGVPRPGSPPQPRRCSPHCLSPDRLMRILPAVAAPGGAEHHHQKRWLSDCASAT